MNHHNIDFYLKRLIVANIQFETSSLIFSHGYVENSFHEVKAA